MLTGQLNSLTTRTPRCMNRKVRVYKRLHFYVFNINISGKS